MFSLVLTASLQKYVMACPMTLTSSSKDHDHTGQEMVILFCFLLSKPNTEKLSRNITYHQWLGNPLFMGI